MGGAGGEEGGGEGAVAWPAETPPHTQTHLTVSPCSVKVTHLQLNFSELHFQPEQFLAFRINNGSIGVHFRRQLLYWFL